MPQLSSAHRLLLGGYRLARRLHLFDLPGARLMFEAAYRQYKRGEARGFSELARVVAPGTTVIDVGANIGVFVPSFAVWVGPTGHVIAVEPEPRNFARLEALVRARGLAPRVRTIRAAVAERSGDIRLRIDPDHPGNHRLGADGTVDVPAVTIDELVRGAVTSAVSLIKIDVQGAEHRVLLGALATIERYRPVLMVEMDDDALREQGSSAAGLLAFLGELSYRPYLLEDRLAAPVADATLLSRCTGGRYCDVCFQPGLSNS